MITKQMVAEVCSATSERVNISKAPLSVLELYVLACIHLFLFDLTKTRNLPILSGVIRTSWTKQLLLATTTGHEERL